MARKISYAQSGVNIEVGDEVVDQLRKSNPKIGGFGGVIPLPRGFKNPRLVLSTDGVGTKLLIAQELKTYHTIGIDLVAMVVNDLIACGAKPFAFLDYYATEKLRKPIATEILKGIASGCEMANCELVGGETAELPGVYPKNGFDLAGFGAGVLEKTKVIDGSKVRAGDVVIGLPSSGIHSNGFSLARKALLEGKSKPRGKKRRELLERMLIPTSIYVVPILKILKKMNVKAIAHITGGGLPGNLVRAVPEGVYANLKAGSWEVPEIFRMIETNGPVAREEMYRVFNMGIGMCVVVPKKQAREAVRSLRRSMVHALEIGCIKKGPRGVVINGTEAEC